MNNSFCLQQIQNTSNLDANLISRQYNINLMADFMRLKYDNPKMKQSEKANHLSLSSSTIQRYRDEINMLSPYKIQSNNIKKRMKVLKILIFSTIHSQSTTTKDLKWPQMTSK